jgi:hypothetical protein
MKPAHGGLSFMGRRQTAWAKRHDFFDFLFLSPKGFKLKLKEVVEGKATRNKVLKLEKGFHFHKV